MRVLILAVFPVCFFLLGWFLAKLDKRHELSAAENLIDDLSVGAAEHQLYDELFAVIAMDKIVKYRRERNGK